MIFLISAFLVLTQISELRDDPVTVRIYLVRKLDPGNCFGMPTVTPDRDIDRTLSDHKGLADRIKTEFKINGRVAIYHKMLQVQRIELSKGQDGYSFVVRDGKCCGITTYRGTVRVGSAAIELNIESETKEAVPC